MNTYIIDLLQIINESSEENKNVFKIEESKQSAYFSTLSDAVYFVQNNLNEVTGSGKYNYVSILGIPMGVINANPVELYLFKHSSNTNSNDEVSKNESVYKFLGDLKNVTITDIKPVIKLDLSKEEIQPTKEFISDLKKNIEEKDYGKIKEMIDQKEYFVSNKINGFLDEVSKSLSSIDDTVNHLFDIFNGKF